MELKHRCSPCHGTGVVNTHDPYTPADIQCPKCSGLGYTTEKIDFPEVEKMEEIKTKLNQMQADINYIKGKVG